MSKIIIRCPECDQQLRVAAPQSGHRLHVHCPMCWAKFEWPEPSRALTVIKSKGAIEPIRQQGTSLALRSFSRDAMTPATKQTGLQVEFPKWFKAPNGFGKMLARTDTRPEFAEVRVLDWVCSHTRRNFRQTFSRNRLGEPFRLVDNGDAGSYLRLARLNGCRISEGKAAIDAIDAFDWSNWQCQHCGHGEITGDQQNFFFCGTCDKLNCASSVHYPRNANATGLCGSCGRTTILNAYATSIGGTRHGAHTPR